MELDTGGFGPSTVSFDYEYDVLKNNTNRRTIQGFSTNADTLMRVGGIDGNPFYGSFQPFIDYYGRADYADHIIQSAVVNNNTDLLNGNFNMKSAEYSQKAAARKYCQDCISLRKLYGRPLKYFLHKISRGILQGHSICDNVNGNSL